MQWSSAITEFLCNFFLSAPLTITQHFFCCHSEWPTHKPYPKFCLSLPSSLLQCHLKIAIVSSSTSTRHQAKAKQVLVWCLINVDPKVIAIWVLKRRNSGIDKENKMPVSIASCCEATFQKELGVTPARTMDQVVLKASPYHWNSHESGNLTWLCLCTNGHRSAALRRLPFILPPVFVQAAVKRSW